MPQIGIPGEMIKLMVDWIVIERYLDVSIHMRTQVMSAFAKRLQTISAICYIVCASWLKVLIYQRHRWNL